MQPTYYVRHPDDTYSAAEPQPTESLVNATMSALSQLGRMVGNSEHENNRIRAALTGAFYEHLPLATPADAGAGLTEELAQQVLNALALAMTICDAVPTRLHKSEDSQLANIGMLVNAQDNGAHGYAVIRDAKAAFEQAATIPKGAARSWDGTTYYNIEEMYHHFEDGEALHMWLDDKGVPRADADGKVFSLVGRVARLSTPGAQVAASDEKSKFEAWATTWKYDLKPAREESRDTYMEGETETAWMGWQARAKLPGSPAPVTAEPAIWTDEMKFTAELDRLLGKWAEAAECGVTSHEAIRDKIARHCANAPAPADRDAIRDQALSDAAQAAQCVTINSDAEEWAISRAVAAIEELKSMERAADAAETRDAEGGV